MMRQLKTLGLAAALAATTITGLATTMPAQAQDYPSDALTFVVPWPAGGRTDIVGRVAASVFGSLLEQPAAVVNRVGGGGAVGTLSVLDAPADGYTILVTTIGNHVLQPVARDVGYTPDDFIPIGQISSATMVLATAADGPYDTIEDVLAAAAESPGEITYGAVPNVLPDRAMQAFAQAAGVEFAQIPTQGDGEGVPMAAGGFIDIVVSSSISSIQSQVDAGQLIPLLTFDAERHESLPDTPTASELGYDVVASPWTGLAVAGGTPDEIVQILRETLVTAIEDPSFLGYTNNAGIDIVYLDGPAFGEVWDAGMATFGGE
ncbi:MAG: tripartite tricarboxylate transporter substrate binding protein [Azospirillaceae bacterium]